MARQPLTHERLLQLLHYDPETGLFRRYKQVGRYKREIAGTPHNRGYWHVSVDGRQYLGHRLAWFYMKGVWPEDEIDHIDLNKSNNRFDNLRPATRQEQNYNLPKFTRNSTGFIGVCYNKARRKYQANFSRDNRLIYIGLFATPEEASAAYQAAIAYRGEFRP